ncbi:MAG: serine/threonine protein kinase [Planctomycetota bacterium]
MKRLSADLPAFDSVWLDALVQTRRLTSFQAQTIEVGLTDRLTIGPGIVLDQIGSGPAAATYLVQIPEAQVPAVIKRIPVATELKAATLGRFRELGQRASSVGHSGVVVPHACHEVPAATMSDRATTKADKGVSPGRRRTQSRRPADLTCELAVASRLVEGLTLTQMLLRRGRIPASVVQEIARQLLESLAALDAAGIVHGEILTDNVLVDATGRTILVDAGVRPALQPEFSFSATIDPKRYSGIAPELIGTSQPYSHRSDLYALGCLLWELLTARPVHPTGDPLARLAAHQTTRIPDVREIAPDTPAALAEAILWLTEREPSKRPQCAAEVLGRGSGGARKSESEVDSHRSTASDSGRVATQRRSLPARTSRRSLTRYSSGFRSRPVGKSSSRSHSNTRFVAHVAAASVVVLIACGALLSLHGQSRDWVTAAILTSVAEADSATDKVGLNSGSESSGVADTISQSSATRTFPQPDAYGLIELSDGSPWRAESILWTGQRLTLRGSSSIPSVVIVDRPIRLRATEIAIDNVEIRFAQPVESEPIAKVSAPGSESTPAGTRVTQVEPLLRFESQNLQIENTVLLSLDDQRVQSVVREPDVAAVGHEQSVASNNPFAFIWAPFNPRDSLPGEITVTDTRIIGSRSSIGIVGTRHFVQCSNVLQSGPGSLFVIAQTQTPGRHEFQLQHCTLRESGGLLEARLVDGDQWRSQILIQPVSCVFDLAQRTGTSSSALVRFRADSRADFRADSLTQTWPETLIISGSDSIARPDLRLVEGVSRDGGHHTELDASQVELEGLIGASFVFQSAAVEAGFDASILKQHDASLGTGTRPGIAGSTVAELREPVPASPGPLLKTGESQ